MRQVNGVSRQRVVTILVGIALVVFDAVCIAGAYSLALATTRPNPGLSHAFATHWPFLLVLLLAWYVAAIAQRLYLPPRGDDLLPQLFAITKAALSALLVSVFLITFLLPAVIRREAIVVAGAAMLVSVLLLHSLVRLGVWGLHLRGFSTNHIVLVGANDTAKRIADVIKGHEQYGYLIEGFLEDDRDRAKALEDHGIAYLGRLSELEKVLAYRVVDEVYIALPMRSFYETILQVAQLCEGVGTPVRLVADRLPLGDANSYLWRLEDVPLLALASNHGLQTRFLTRRARDWLTSSLLLVVLSPVFAVIAAFIKIESRGPVFVSQTRKGRNGGNFALIRFRCTEDGGADREEVGEAGGVRLTRVGRFLRRYNLDELPHLINVWYGQMGLVGPKPSVPAGPDRAVPESPHPAMAWTRRSRQGYYAHTPRGPEE